MPYFFWIFSLFFEIWHFLICNLEIFWINVRKWGYLEKDAKNKIPDFLMSKGVLNGLDNNPMIQTRTASIWCAVATLPYLSTKNKKIVKNFKKHFRSIFSPNQAISSNLFSLTFWQQFSCLDPQKSHFLTFGNDPTIIVQYQ